eukprot:3637596-Lingulodinium_polyedra.AAC.1
MVGPTRTARLPRCDRKRRCKMVSLRSGPSNLLGSCCLATIPRMGVAIGLLRDHVCNAIRVR